MKDFILNKLLYNQMVKNFANTLLGWPPFFRNPLYRHFLDRQIKRVITRYRKTPFALRIENTNVCNARCYMCPHAEMKRKQGFMSRSLYQKLIDEAVKWGIDFVNLHNFGEPLLDKDFIWRVRYAKQNGIVRVSTNTNAQPMAKKVARQLTESGLDEIFISLDAASRKVYEKIRIGLDFDKVWENVKYLVAWRNKLGAAHPKIIVDFLESDLNRHEVKKFIEQWRDLADSVCVSKIHDWSCKKTGVLRPKYPNYVSFSQVPCRLPFTELLINWGGTASLCCQDIEGEVIIGDANNQSLREIWWGKELERIRKKHLSIDVNQLSLCSACKLRTFWWVF